MGYKKVMLLSKEHGDPPFLFQNLSSYNIGRARKLNEAVAGGVKRSTILQV